MTHGVTVAVKLDLSQNLGFIEFRGELNFLRLCGSGFHTLLLPFSRELLRLCLLIFVAFEFLH